MSREERTSQGDRLTSASYKCRTQGKVSAENEWTVANPSLTSVIAAFSVLFKYREPIKPPDLSMVSTSNSTSRCMYLRVANSKASAPDGSLFSDAFRAVRGARIPVLWSVLIGHMKVSETYHQEPKSGSGCPWEGRSCYTVQKKRRHRGK